MSLEDKFKDLAEIEEETQERISQEYRIQKCEEETRQALINEKAELIRRVCTAFAKTLSLDMKELQGSWSSLGLTWYIKRFGEESYNTDLPSISLRGPAKKGLYSGDYDNPEDHVVVHANLPRKHMPKFRKDPPIMTEYSEVVPLRNLTEKWLTRTLREAYQIASAQKLVKTPQEALFDEKMALVRRVCTAFAKTIGSDVYEEGLKLHIKLNDDRFKNRVILEVALLEGWGNIPGADIENHDRVCVDGASYAQENIIFRELTEKKLVTALGKVYKRYYQAIMERYR